MSDRCLKSMIVIPARLNSTRLPQKLLLRETGKTLIQHTFEAAASATIPCEVCVATDSPAIAREVAAFGGRAVMTNPAAASGTERITEIARTRPDIDVFVNVQGDEPEITGAAIDTAIGLLLRDPHALMSTLATPIRFPRQLHDPACVKVVVGLEGHALYFSRSAIPFPGDAVTREVLASQRTFLQHLGVYAYRRDFLGRFSELPATPLEQCERLEQLRVLEAGYQIQVGIIEHAAEGIDTLDDYRRFVARQRQRALPALTEW